MSLKTKFESILNTARKAFKRLHEKGNYIPSDLKKEPAYQQLLGETNDLFDFAVSDNVMSDTMAKALRNDVFLFSGLKTHAQLFEASRLLLDDAGNIKPFHTFSADIESINNNFNKTYLSAEYEFAINSSQMAGKWSEFNDSNRYALQYRTANDSRVRDSHAKLNGITLPKSDSFWSSYYAPNGWNCRCTVTEVIANDYEVSDNQKATKLGEEATTQLGKDGKNKLAIFRFNPGKDKVIFPPSHPYSKVAGAKKVIQDLKK